MGGPNSRLPGLEHDGQRSQDPPYLLQGQAVPQAHPAQGHPVQDWQGLALRSGQASLRQEAVRLRWSDQARFHKKAKTTKKVVLRLECTVCKYKMQMSLKRCKHFELG